MRQRSGRSVIALLSFVVLVATSPLALADESVTCPDGPRKVLNCKSSMKQTSSFIKLSASFLHWLLPSLEIGSRQLIDVDNAATDFLIQSEKLCEEYNACVISAQEYKDARSRLQEAQQAFRLAMAEVQRAGVELPKMLASQLPEGQTRGDADTLTISEFKTDPMTEYDATQLDTRRGAEESAVTAFPVPLPPLIDTTEGDSSGLAYTAMGDQPVSGSAAASASVPMDVQNLSGSSKIRLRDRILKPIIKAAEQGILSTPVEERTSFGGWLGQVAKTTLWNLGKGLLGELEAGLAKLAPERIGQEVAVGNFNYEDTGYGTPVGQAVAQQIIKALSRSRSLRSAPLEQVRGGKNLETRVPLVLEGKVWDLGDRVEVSTTLLDSTTRQPLVRALRRVDKSELSGKLRVGPDNLSEAMRTDRLMEGVVSLSSGGPFRIRVWTDRGSGGTYTDGDRVQVYVQASQNCYLRLFYIQADQSVVQVFPNRFQKDHQIKAGDTVMIPPRGATFKFQVSPPFGVESIVAVATLQPVSDLTGKIIDHEFRVIQGQTDGFAAGLRGLTMNSTGGDKPEGIVTDRVILTTMSPLPLPKF